MNGRNRNKFLKLLLSKGFICEEAIDSLVFDGRRFDLMGHLARKICTLN